MKVILKKSVRAKRTSIRIRLGNIILTVPKNGCVDRAFKFLDSHMSALSNQLSKFQKTSFMHGDVINILGKKYNIIHNKALQTRIILNGNELVISNISQDVEKHVIKFLSSHLMQKISEIASVVCSRIGVSYNKLSVKNMHSKWGSCNSNGNLSFCWKLIFFDEKILEYVVVHEVCHLKEMNHSENFWKLVEIIYPNWREARRWLKNEGKYII